VTAAAIYARVSSARQAKDQTIGSQLTALREHAATSRLDVPEEWVFADEGHSGATLVRPALEALRDLAAQGCLDVVLVYSPDRLARKFAYQALLIEELARCGVRVEFVKGPRGDSPEDQLLVQFQGMFAEYEKAQLMERYRRGKAWRAKTGSVNVLGGAPFGYRYVRKTPESGARYEVVPHEAALVAEMFRRYADDGAAIADLGRWLTAEGVATRTGKERWDRSVIWGMLRNPAYAGTAVFGKTRVVHEPAGLNRTARLAGRTVPRQVRTQDRPREEWTGIPVPALVDEETFDRVQQRLQDNKRFASRNTKVPSLLQGIAACAACGYGYYRTTTTTTAGNKIYYYRCLGSDDYRYQGGRVCGNKPVRADYADRVVWDHVTALLADPALIRAEISKRLERARTSDPVTRKRGQLEQALAKTGKSIAAMITAFSEQLITIDELRTRMPALRARETGIKDQIAALDAQAADRDAYLKLAGDLEGFLARLRDSAAIATTGDRQRVLRAVVQDILIGPEKITIRHRIPVREHSSGGGHHDTTDTEGDMRGSSLLRWGRDHPALGGPGRSPPHLPVLHHPGAQHRAQQLQDGLVANALLHRLHQLLVRNRGKAARDVRLHHPPPTPPGLINEHLQGIVRRPPRAEPETARQEVRLEDRLEHDLHRGLHDPVANGRNRERTLLRGPRLRYQHPPGRQRPVPALPQLAGQLFQEPGDPVLLDSSQGDLVDARRAVVPAHRDPRAPQNIAAADLVIQRVEPTSGIGLGRPVQRMLQGTDRVPGYRRPLRGGTSLTGTHRAPP
jgi:site-specific DNA recombinase